MTKRISILSVLSILLCAGSGVMAQTSGRVTIAVLDLAISTGVPESYRIPLSNRLRHELFETGRFTVVERNAMENILAEQGLQLSECTSDECAVQLGRLLNVQRIIAGSLDKLGETHIITLRMIDVETAAMIHSKAVDCRCPIDEVVTVRLRDVAVMLAREEYPDIASGNREKPVRWYRDISPRTTTGQDNEIQFFIAPKYGHVFVEYPSNSTRSSDFFNLYGITAGIVKGRWMVVSVEYSSGRKTNAYILKYAGLSSGYEFPLYGPVSLTPRTGLGWDSILSQRWSWYYESYTSDTFVHEGSVWLISPGISFNAGIITSRVSFDYCLGLWVISGDSVGPDDCTFFGPQVEVGLKF